MAVNKVVYGDKTVMDISDTTATAVDVKIGKQFHASNGDLTIGLNSESGAAATVFEVELIDQTTNDYLLDISYQDAQRIIDVMPEATASSKGLMSSTDKAKLNTFGDATDYALATQIPSSAVFSVTSVQNAYTTETGVTAKKYGNVYAVNINFTLTAAFPAGGAQTTVAHINNWPSSLPSILLNIPAQTDGSKIMIYWVKPSGDITIQSVTGAPKSTYRGSGCVINS